MNKINKFDEKEYLSLLLVLSFFIHHNIYIVFAGISLAIYTINTDIINYYIKTYIKTYIKKNKKDSEIKESVNEIKKKLL